MTSKLYKGIPVKRVPWPWPQPPGVTWGGVIYLRSSLWRDFLSGNPEPETLAFLEHEKTHVDRLGSNFVIWLKYWLKPKFRLKEEVAAIKAEMKVLKSNGLDFDVNKRASVWYLRTTDHNILKNKLEELWDEV